MLSRKADYGVRAMLDIARQSGSARVVVSDVAKRQNIPVFYLAKIMPRLARAGLVHTVLGASGGISLALPADQISLLQVIEAIDGSLSLNICSLDSAQCDQAKTCPACDTWHHAQAQLTETLASTYLSDLIARRGNELPPS